MEVGVSVSPVAQGHDPSHRQAPERGRQSRRTEVRVLSLQYRRVLNDVQNVLQQIAQPLSMIVNHLRPLLQPPPCFQLIHCKVAVHTHVARATLPNRHHARLYRPRLPHSAYSDSHCLPSTFLFSLYLRVHLTIVLYLYHLACVLWLPSHVYKPPPSVL